MDIPVIVNNDSHEHETHEHREPEHQKSAGGSSGRTGMVIVVILVIAAGIWLASRNQGTQSPFSKQTQNETPQMTELAASMQTATPAADANAISIQNDWIANIADIAFTHAGTLVDVSGGNASGTVGTDVITGVYHLYATFNNLPTLPDGFYYEGWLVRMEPLSIISTGALTVQNGKYVNAYLSRTDLRDHATYVLTMETSGGDAGPETHILKGAISPN